MRPTYYVIELSARWLTVLVVALAAAVAAAFALGYGAGRSSVTDHGPRPLTARLGPTATPEAAVVGQPEIDEVTVSEATPVPAEPTVTPPADWVRPTAPPTDTPVPATATAPPPTATAEPEATEAGLWVQVVATSRREAVERARRKLDDLGFPAANQRVVSSPVAGGNVLYKVRVGPFPDRESADRVVRRMQAAGYPDAWVVSS